MTIRNNIEHIKQPHKTSCGVTSVAMIANIRYKKAIKFVLPKKKKHADYGANVYHMAIALERLGFSTKIVNRRSKSLINIKHDAILILKEPGKNNYHAVVWDAKRKAILDPSADQIIPLKKTWLFSPLNGIVTATKYYEPRVESYIEVRKCK